LNTFKDKEDYTNTKRR